ncbi:MAG: sodium:alanine symporter family protein [Microscillaceae bacterium]
MKSFEASIIYFSKFIWGEFTLIPPILVVLLGGGLYFLLYSRFLPFRYFGHAIEVLRGKYDDQDDPGDLNHYEALAAAMAATIGVGNISGVAVAIAVGGPGAMFWMWVSAIVGMATKFFTCTLAVMYRGRDSQGHLQGGPMYVIVEGLGARWRPLAVFFSVAGLVGCFPLFQANQLTQVFREVLLIPAGWVSARPEAHFVPNFIIGLVIVLMVSLVIFGGIRRIGKVAGRMVPLMVGLYVACAMLILLMHLSDVPASLWLIFTDAFTGQAAMGGLVGLMIIQGVKRAVFSNEAGIGTAPMMHGAAKTKEPVREGLVAMLGPFLDTIVVCSMTALVIVVTGVWQDKSANGVTLTARAFEQALPGVGAYILVLCIFIFAITTLFSYSYYGVKCFGFLFGAKYQDTYNILYVASIIFGAVASLEAAVSLIDAMYALMSIPTILSAVILSPKVRRAALDYFRRHKAQKKKGTTIS